MPATALIPPAGGIKGGQEATVRDIERVKAARLRQQLLFQQTKLKQDRVKVRRAGVQLATEEVGLSKDRVKLGTARTELATAQVKAGAARDKLMFSQAQRTLKEMGYRASLQLEGIRVATTRRKVLHERALNGSGVPIPGKKMIGA